MSNSHCAYIISDLHLGGEKGGPNGGRGFQLCTQTALLAEFIESLSKKTTANETIELVIAGDFVDFLAEPNEKADEDEPRWTPLRENEEEAARLLQKIVSRHPEVFSALKGFVGAGHTLTVLLGNHDIELAYPVVRKTLQNMLGMPSSVGMRFLHDGEAYSIGDALIEHGNRYDEWNALDYDALRRTCSLFSRGQDLLKDGRFVPPAGSRLVAEVMNPIKVDFPFIDLLKPETTAAVPLLLVLKPEARSLVAKLAKLALSANKHGADVRAVPKQLGDISADVLRVREPTLDIVADVRTPQVLGNLDRRVGMGDEDADLRHVLESALGASQATAFLRELEGGTPQTESLLRKRTPDHGDISAGPTPSPRSPDQGRTSAFQGGLSWVKLLLSAGGDTEGRLRSLQDALRAFCDPSLFDLDKSPPKDPFYAAAKVLGQKTRFRYVVMGHTHLARKLPLEGGGFYLNSGTWADLMKIPSEVFQPDEQRAFEALRTLAKDINERQYQRLIMQRPTYVKLEVRDEKVVRATVETYQAGNKL